MDKIVVFTSITKNYLAKAKVLAKSFKAFHPDIEFHCVFSESLDEHEDAKTYSAFDRVVGLHQVAETFSLQWLFMHSLVETCTTVKPLYLTKLLKEGVTKVIYLDPDTKVFHSLETILEWLDSYEICLTPHITGIDFERQSILDNEISAAKHGVYNLGFFAVSSGSEGKKFAQWWADRVVNFGYAQTFMGCFTDQKICDFVPAYFDKVLISRHPGLNVAHWNLSTRNITVENDIYYVNGQPLLFYHFSSFDSGVGEKMAFKYSEGNKSLVNQIWLKYIKENEEQGSSESSQAPWPLAYFDNGQAITLPMRLFYRQNNFCRYIFENPFATSGNSFLKYWHENDECRKFENAWKQATDFLSGFSFPGADQFLEKKLTALSTFVKPEIGRLFIYGLNKYASEVIDILTLKGIDKFILLDIDPEKSVNGATASTPDSFQFNEFDKVIICGKAKQKEMRATIVRYSTSEPEFL
ncbi:hypothetical protein OPS25_03715 [Alteromonas ponticola]|uniref:Glycosyl transferase n=1 Tax=Alteromonas aquimaris TaxID=2998417 RepID=A0ABT3P4G2_9ALTE|nr:hypothetical protein [Alteromonas aquimaris]MCW8107612.1 hypothetical protein [Alteromonas aquimaris]